MSSVTVSASTTRRIRRLRMRMTALITVVAATAVAVLSTVVLVLNARLLDEQQTADVLTAAQDVRAAVSVEDGVVLVDPLLDGADGVVVLARETAGEGAPSIVPDGSPIPDDDLVELAAFTAETEENESDRVDVDGESYVMLALPIFDGDELVAVALGTTDVTEVERDSAALRRSVLGFAMLMVVGAAVAAWLVAGRSVRPVAQALAEQERFIADAAHEMRTPITALRVSAESAAAERPDDERLADIVRLIERTSSLTDDLLTLARIDASRHRLQLEPLRLDLMVDVLVDELELVQVDDAVDGAVVVDGDAALLERAVSNLLRNGLEHGAPTPDEPIRVVVDQRGVRVSDRGPGAPVDERAAIFERFSSRPGSPGHGLGLPLARWIAEAHGGSLRYADREGGGAEFVLALPTRPT